MKFKRILSVGFLWTICNLSAIAQAPPVLDWQKCFGGTSVDEPDKIIRSNDGGYIIAGSTTSNNCDVNYNHGGRDIWILKTDELGNIQWQKAFGGSSSDFASSIIQLSNNDIVIAGYTSSNNGNVSGNHGGQDEWLLRIDSDGNLIWQKTFGGASADICYALALCNDGGFILGGSSSSINGNVTGNHGNKDFWIVKTDSDGNLEWQQSLGGTGSEECYSIIPTADGYIASGLTNSNDGQVTNNHGGYDYWITKLDLSGNLQWQKCLGGSANDVPTVSIINSSGQIMVGGYSNSSDGDITEHHGSSDYWLTWIDSSNGNLIQQRSYGGSNSDIAYDLIPTADGGYMLAGASLSNDMDVPGNYGGEDFWLTKTDASGNIAWARNYGGSGNDRPASVVQTDDGGFSVVGYTYSNDHDVSSSHNSADIWFLKLSCLTPVSNFWSSADSICVNSLMSFTNTSIHSAVYQWRVNDIPFSNNTNSSFEFYSPGTFKITLIGSTCYASDTLDKYITVFDYPVPSITSSDNYLCEGGSATLSTITADSYSWSDGENASTISVNEGGTYSVTVTVNGCSSSTSLNIPEYLNPEINLGDDTTICSGSSIELNAPTSYLGYTWQDGSSNSSFNANADGWYSVEVNDGHCRSTDSIHVSVIPCAVLVAGFSSSQTTICKNSCIDFFDLSQNANGWNWSFPNSNTATSTDQNPTGICYDTPGTYPVYLEVYGANNSSTGLMQMNYITVNDLPLVPVISINGTFLTSPHASAYQWFLNSVAINNAVSRSYNALQEGYYSVQVTNPEGCTSISDSVFIGVTGIRQQTDQRLFSVYPNPSTGTFNISIADPSAKKVEIKISDAAGKTLRSISNEKINGTWNEIIDLENLSNGVYFLEVKTETKVADQKLLIER